MGMEEFQQSGVLDARESCLRRFGESSLVNSTKAIYNKTLDTFFCPAYFDLIMCWPNTPANTTAVQRCADYLIGFNATQNATRQCMPDGQWYLNEYHTYWTNYTNCIIGDEIQVEEPISVHNYTYIKEYLPTIKMISRIGYSVSLVTLIVAFIIMFSVKKLHCPRNKLHMHLFASFMLRALVILVKDLTFVDGVGLTSDIVLRNETKRFLENDETGNWGCKVYFTLFQFFITANYSWILMEGIYLHNLIFRAMFADSNRSITHYVAVGWGMPLVVTSMWVVARISVADTFCWTTNNDDKRTFLIIRIPTAISILLNLVLFVRIAVVIFNKLQAHVYEEARRYQKWARSTLVLAPLFGIHYAIFLVMSTWIDINEIIELIWLTADQSFGSFQGFFVAILYCFLNSEVRTELKPHVHLFLTYIATNKYLKYLFPCREKYLRSTRGRASVCTTMSCSSLFNNGVNHHRNSRTRWDFMARNKSANVQDRNREHVCRSNIRSWHEAQTRWNTARCSTSGCPRTAKHYNFSSNGSISNEKTTCLDHQEKSKSDSQLLGENLSMLPRN